MTHEELLLVMQHTPLPERLGDFERTRSPKETEETALGTVIVEYRHMFEDVVFQVVMKGDDAVFQIVQGGVASPMRQMTVQEAGHVLRSDLMMILEDLEDEL
jgi:hypothetical protein